MEWTVTLSVLCQGGEGRWEEGDREGGREGCDQPCLFSVSHRGEVGGWKGELRGGCRVGETRVEGIGMVEGV